MLKEKEILNPTETDSWIHIFALFHRITKLCDLVQSTGCTGWETETHRAVLTRVWRGAGQIQMPALFPGSSPTLVLLSTFPSDLFVKAQILSGIYFLTVGITPGVAAECGG